MTEIGGSVRCPRGHLTAAGYQFCTTCGERVAPATSARVADAPPRLGDGPTDGSIGFVLPPDLEPPAPGDEKKRGRLLGGIGRRTRKPEVPDAIAEPPPGPPDLLPIEPPAPPPERGTRRRRRRKAQPEGVEASTEPPVPPAVEPANERWKRGAGRLRRKKAPAQAAPGGPSLLTDADAPDLESVEYVPPPSTPSASPDFGDVEFAIGPGTRSVVTYGRPERATTRSAGGTRGPAGLPTRALVAILVVVAAIGAAIIFFVTRDPATPSIAPSTLPTVQPTMSAPIATVAPAVAVSEECANAFAFAAARAAEADAPSFQQRTLRLCTTSDEWLAAARLHPTAIGVTGPSEVGEDDLARVCSGAPSVGICRSVAASTPTSGPPTSGSPAATSTVVPSP